MGRYTAAYSGFIQRLSEIQALLVLAKEVTLFAPTSSTLTRINTLCRGGVVLLSSHVEGYIEDLGEIIIDQIASRNMAKSKLGNKFRYYLSHDLISSIRQSSDPENIEAKILNLISRDSHIWDNSINYQHPLRSDVFIGDFQNPNHNRIKKFFRRFGYENFDRDLRIRLRVQYQICINMLDQMVEQRNKIAHGNVIVTATPTDLQQMMDLIKQYCRDTDCSTAEWFRNQGCPIR